jgi:hypothetical protein
MKQIGGYFGLELAEGASHYHETPYTFKSGRAALSFVLDAGKPRKLFVPYYCCDSLFDPIIKSKIPFEYYEIDSALEPTRLPDLEKDEMFIYVNYFDLKRVYSEYLSNRYKSQLIVDCTQAFFSRSNGNSWYFNSCRKFFGVPDGSYLYIPENFSRRLEPITEENRKYVYGHLLHRFNGDTEAGYKLSLENEALIDSEPLAMSRLSKYLLSHVDYVAAQAARRRNYAKLRSLLSETNRLAFKTDLGVAVPHYFPLLADKLVPKETLWKEQLFVPYLWKECINRKVEGFEFERELSSRLLPLTVDQRYSESDMEYVASKILPLLEAR